MKTASKAFTYKNTGANIPVQIKGFSREWNLKANSVGPDGTFLGVVPNEDSSINGAVFQLPLSQYVSEALESYDQREHLYCRKLIDIADIEFLIPDNNTISTEDNYYWIYVNKDINIAGPSKYNPIVQSYVDVFISGCLELQNEHDLPGFAKKCVETTKGWSAVNWINDRIFPRRPYVHEPKAREIDALLQDVIPTEFGNIRVE